MHKHNGSIEVSALSGEALEQVVGGGEGNSLNDQLAQLQPEVQRAQEQRLLRLISEALKRKQGQNSGTSPRAP